MTLSRSFVFAPALMLAATGCASTAERSASSATPGASQSHGYVVSSGNFVRDGSGKCVRTGHWRPEDANRTCEPEMFAKLDAEKARLETERKAKEAAEQRALAEAEEAGRRAKAEAEAAAAAAARQAEPTWRFVGADAYFETDQAQLDQRSRQVLNSLVERAREAEQVRVTIVGHADSTGDAQHNMKLSQERAEAVRAYLVEQGLPGQAIALEARGENDPVIECERRAGAERAQCLQVNRRSEIVLSVLEPQP